MISYIGLALIIVSWIIQFINKSKEISPIFVGVYALGVVLLAIDGFTGGLIELAVLNVVSGVVSLGVLVKLIKK